MFIPGNGENKKPEIECWPTAIELKVNNIRMTKRKSKLIFLLIVLPSLLIDLVFYTIISTKIIFSNYFIKLYTLFKKNLATVEFHYFILILYL